MLKINERRMCGVPVLIEGETGVGKTALIEMLSLLWNNEWKQKWVSVQQNLLLRLIEGMVILYRQACHIASFLGSLTLFL